MNAMSPSIADDAYRWLFDANPHPMWVFDRDTLRFLAANDAAQRQYGYTLEEFVNLTILDIRSEEDAHLVTDSLVPSLSVPKIWCHRRKDGSTLLAEITAHDIQFKGRAARLVLALDVTVRERNAQLVRRSHRTLEAVLKAAPIGVMVIMPDGKVGERNEEARRLLEDQGQAVLVPLIERTLAGESLGPTELEIESDRWVEVSTRPLDLGHDTHGGVIILADATERRAKRAQLAQQNEDLEVQVRERTAALQTTDQELQEFCFSVSHDLRGPLRAVDGFTQSVLSDPDARLTEENRDSLTRVRRAATRMGELIDGLLVLSRVSRAPLNPAPIDLAALATRSAADLVQANPDRKLVFTIEPGLKAYGDPNLVTMLVDCLFGNSVKFSAGRDESRIELSRDGDGWKVTDNGVGFDMAYAAKLFKPFERLHATAAFPGNGLGLAVADRIVRRHGGTIKGAGIPNHGSSFRFTLPYVEKV
jgi:PAS domain S-box-containing protein